jgi:CheY-like chemotaxis protein
MPVDITTSSSVIIAGLDHGLLRVDLKIWRDRTILSLVTPVTPPTDEVESARPTLLIADDDPIVRTTLTTALGREFEVVGAAGDSDEAVSIAALKHPDVALVDVAMPGGGGITAVRGIVASSPATAVVVLSGDEVDSVVRELLRAGASSYLRKGIAFAELARALDASIRAHRGTVAATG